MRLNKVSIENFKCFQEAELDLNGQSTVLFGINGTGKSTVLSAINYCCWPWINRLNASQGIAYRSLDSKLVRYGASQLQIQCVIEMGDKSHALVRAYSKARIGARANSFYNKKQYDAFIESFGELYLDQNENMPVFVNYGTNRAVLDIPLRIRQKHQFSKLTALERAIENDLDFRTFFEWYRNQEDIENEYIRETGNRDYQDKYLACVRKAIETMLDNVSDLRVKRSPLRMTVKKGPIEIVVDQLSDGEKCTLALFGDLARRVAMANPNRNNPLEGSGIVLIDEIELHMHPSWQRRVLKVLREVFPHIQFIVTTHSPLVLGEVFEDCKVFKLSRSSEGKEYFEEVSTYGKDVNWILKYDMGTDERTKTMLSKFQEFYNAIDHRDYASAKNILNDLYNKIGDDPEISNMQIQLDMEQIGEEEGND